jgi:DNA-binding Xre family transcriptional regulator
MGLGEKTGISWRNIQKIESGDFKLENIRAKNFLALAEALGVEPKELI